MNKTKGYTMLPHGPLVAVCTLLCVFASPSWAVNDESLLEGLANFETAAGGDIDSPTPARPAVTSNLVRRIQTELSDQGFYLGPIDGRFGPQTEAAIRAYQESADMKVDGKATEQLAQDLSTGGKVGKLLKRLEDTRSRSIESARDALLANPDTRYLIEGNATEDKTRKHDSKACMENPKPRCLLIEAVDSARDIDKPEMRDWALGEILTAQARAGLAKDATATTRRIHDPRLIMVALRDIAKARAELGEIDDAIAAIDIIPDPLKRIEAYVAIAEIQTKSDPDFDPANTVQNLAPYLEQVPSLLAQVSFRTRIAAVLAKAGHENHARTHIEAAEQELENITETEERDKGRRYIAAAYAESGLAKKALEVLKSIENGSDDAPVLIAAATGLAQSGEAHAALITADSIEAVRYRALVLARIASYQGGAGQISEAKDTLIKAKEASIKIKFPFAKAYAFSRIALAYNDVSISAGDTTELFDQAIESAHLISDDRLKAHIFWTIADERRRGADLKGATQAQEEARKATEDILSPFSRVWMLCDIAVERAKRNEDDAAWSIFGVAMDEAKTISNPWGRARALSKTAATMTSLTDKTVETARSTPNQ
ncbi:MAG: peptidoglycan-binding protein [Magnetovibrio sp.]|nr:peptidoglycan-binding protein [Magnetovibrio sp.]